MEKFFIKSFTVSEVTEELLLRRYNNIEYIMRKEFEEGYDFIKVAYETTLELDAFIGQLQKFGNTETQIVFSTPVEHRGIEIPLDI